MRGGVASGGAAHPAPPIESAFTSPPARGKPADMARSLVKPARLFTTPQVLVSALIVGTLFINTLPGNLAIVDVVLVCALLFYALPSIAILGADPAASAACLRVIVPAIALLFLGVALAILKNGNPIIPLKNFAAILYLIAPVLILGTGKRRYDLPLPLVSLAIATLCLSWLVLAQPESRPTGTFENPNHTSSWLAAAMMVITVAKFPRRAISRYALVIIALLAMLKSGSFGAIVALACSWVYWVTSRRRGTATAVGASAAALGLSVAFLLPRIDQLTQLNRLDRSSYGRLSIWHEAWMRWLANPFGSGPGAFGVSESGVLKTVAGEAHNDYLDTLVELGLLGALALCTLLAALWFASKETRPMFVLLAISFLTHSALNYRHLWLGFGILLALAYAAPDSPNAANARRPNRSAARPSRSLGL